MIIVENDTEMKEYSLYDLEYDNIYRRIGTPYLYIIIRYCDESLLLNINTQIASKIYNYKGDKFTKLDYKLEVFKECI
jgi:hypothetical protein